MGWFGDLTAWVATSIPCITVVVGLESNQKSYIVSKEALYLLSGYFANILKDESFESRVRSVRLDDDISVDTFKQFWMWMHFGRLPALHDSNKKMRRDCLIANIDLYALAHRLSVPILENEILSRFYDRYIDGLQFPSAYVLKRAFSSLPISSQLCHLLFDSSVRKMYYMGFFKRTSRVLNITMWLVDSRMSKSERSRREKAEYMSEIGDEGNLESATRGLSLSEAIFWDMECGYEADEWGLSDPSYTGAFKRRCYKVAKFRRILCGAKKSYHEEQKLS